MEIVVVRSGAEGVEVCFFTIFKVSPDEAMMGVEIRVGLFFEQGVGGGATAFSYNSMRWVWS